MQATMEVNAAMTTSKQSSENQRLREKKLKDLMVDKRRLVEVPYTASLAHTMNALVANKVMAVPVAAPPGHWIGAGGSMIMESDKHTGVVRKQYIGMVTMLDILAHIAGDDRVDGGDDGHDLERRMADPISSVIGHSLEGLSLWTLNPNTSVLDCMEVLSKGIHRALVPVDGQVENITGAELVESASCYRILTQMDVLKFLKDHEMKLDSVVSRTVKELEAINESVVAITDRTKMIEAIKCMKAGLLNAVPIVSSIPDEDHSMLVNGRGMKLVGTFSATDLRGCHIATLQTWLSLTALEFTDRIATSPLFTASSTETGSREMVTCYTESTLAEVIEKLVTKHVHRIWVIDSAGLLLGLISLTDVIRVMRLSLLSQS